jgi:ADP-ribosylglycohydrolase
VKPSDHARRIAAARKSLDGLSVGDALGETFFGRPETVRQRIEARALPAGPLRYTDDTVMALSIVDVLDRFGQIEQDELALLFARRFRKDPARGYGGTASDILDRIDRGTDWRITSSAAFNGAGSMGNGAAMRAAPIGAYFADSVALAAENARLSAEVTHSHIEGKAGAVAVAAAASHVAGGGRRDRLFDVVLEAVPPSQTRDAIAEASRIRRSSDAVAAAARLGSGNRVLSQDTVPFCLWCVHQSADDFQAAFWTTVAGLGDRDTTCAIVGGIVAAQHSAAVPADWLARRESLERFRV